MELHLDEIRAGLAVGEMPPPYEVRPPTQPLPPELASRARRVAAAQRDVQDELRGRLGVLARILGGAFSEPPVPVYLDRRD